MSDENEIDYIPLPQKNQKEINNYEKSLEKKVKDERKRRKIVLKKYKGTFKSYHELANFKEPVAILLRRGRKAEFYENVNKSTFSFKHSDGDERAILLDNKTIHSFDYGKKSFNCYILHEDHPLPLPTDPLITLEQMGSTIDKVLADTREWKIKETKAKTDLVWKILIGIAIIIIAYGLYKIMAPQDTSGTAEKVVETAINNGSRITGETAINIIRG